MAENSKVSLSGSIESMMRDLEQVDSLYAQLTAEYRSVNARLAELQCRMATVYDAKCLLEYTIEDFKHQEKRLNKMH